jgi:hypothetical protein
MKPGIKYLLPLTLFLFAGSAAVAQEDATVKARVDARTITVGDQVRLFIEATNNNKTGSLKWATIPDTFDHLEVVERSNIDTTTQGDVSIYKQRLLITGFDSGMFRIPPFVFAVIPNTGQPYTLYSDSFHVSVSTVPVDTSKPFQPIKEIIAVKTTWRDYIWYIIGGVVFLALAAFVVFYFIRHKKTPIPSFIPKTPAETPQEQALRLLAELEQQQLWQQGRVKEYYSILTDILRNYVEKRFRIPAMEKTSDELLQDALKHPEMNPQYATLSMILTTADMAKFAKAQPLPQQHVSCMEGTKEFVNNTRPVLTETTENAS